MRMCPIYTFDLASSRHRGHPRQAHLEGDFGPGSEFENRPLEVRGN